ncbi:MAG: TolC family protein, partial [Deltaproteobacteria bacterium]|nr:TolC family protein [Deltaproteobacteria bacterium]
NLRPQISLEERFLRTDNPTYVFMSKLNQERFSMQDLDIGSLNDPAPENDFQTTLAFFQPLLAMQAAIGIEMSETAYAAHKEEFYRSQEALALQVARTFLMAQLAEEYILVAQKGLEDASEHLRIAEVSYDNGLGLYADTLRAATAVSEAEQKLVSAEKNLKVTRRSLGLMLGLDQSISTTDEDLDVTLRDLEFYTKNVELRRDIQSMQLHFENARNNVRLNKAAYIPTLGVGSSFQLNDEEVPFGSNGESWQVFALFKWELFDGAKRQHEKQKAHYQVAETRERMIQLMDAAAFLVYESFLGVEEAEKNLALARSALTSAREGQRLVRIRYENSLSPMVDLLDSQVSLDQARINLLMREKEQQLATLKLCFESGIILQELGLEAVKSEND